MSIPFDALMMGTEWLRKRQAEGDMHPVPTDEEIEGIRQGQRSRNRANGDFPG